MRFSHRLERQRYQVLVRPKFSFNDVRIVRSEIRSRMINLSPTMSDISSGIVCDVCHWCGRKYVLKREKESRGRERRRGRWGKAETCILVDNASRLMSPHIGHNVGYKFTRSSKWLNCCRNVARNLKTTRKQFISFVIITPKSFSCNVRRLKHSTTVKFSR
jgi:hypothetical protein